MTIALQLHTDMINAMKAKDTLKLSVIRMAKTLISLKEKETKLAISDIDVDKILKSMIKQRKDSVDQFTRGLRLDLAEKELAEIAILEQYLPQEISHEQLVNIIAGITAYIREDNQMNIGWIMKELNALAAGKKGGTFRFDSKQAAEIIRERVKHGISDLASTIN